MAQGFQPHSWSEMATCTHSPAVLAGHICVCSLLQSPCKLVIYRSTMEKYPKSVFQRQATFLENIRELLRKLVHDVGTIKTSINSIGQSSQFCGTASGIAYSWSNH